MLLTAERGRIDLGEPSHDAERGELWLGRKPAFNRRQMRIELRGHAYALFVLALWPPMGGAHLSRRRRGAERLCKDQWIDRRRAGSRTNTALANPLAELVLTSADLGQQCHRIETAIGLAQPTLDRLRQLRMRQCPRVGRRRHVVALDHFGALAPLLLELERGLEEVHEEPRRRIEPRHHPCRLDAVEAAVADEPAHDGTVLCSAAETLRAELSDLEDAARRAENQVAVAINKIISPIAERILDEMIAAEAGLIESNAVLMVLLASDDKVDRDDWLGGIERNAPLAEIREKFTSFIRRDRIGRDEDRARARELAAQWDAVREALASDPFAPWPGSEPSGPTREQLQKEDKCR